MGSGLVATFVGFALIGILFSLGFRSSRPSRQRHHNLSRIDEPQEKDADHVLHELSANSPILELGDEDAGPLHAQRIK